jgi:hypothetical protein
MAVVTHFASGWTNKLPAHKTGGLYKTSQERGGLLLYGPFRPVDFGTEWVSSR